MLQGCRTPWSGRNSPTTKRDSDITIQCRTNRYRKHQSTLDDKKTTEQVYAGPTGIYSMPYMGELGAYLDQTTLLRKDFRIREITGNFGQRDRISFVSLTQ